MIYRSHNLSVDYAVTQMSKGLSVSVCALAAGLLLSGCGGDASAPAVSVSSSGLAVDGYLSGSTVLCDTNGNGAADSGETTVRTDSSGFFLFPNGCTSALVVTGGTSTDTQLSFLGTLKAPAGAKVVTPFTTLISAGMTQARARFQRLCGTRSAASGHSKSATPPAAGRWQSRHPGNGG